MVRIAIVGVGNDLMRDDGIGPHVVRRLNEMGVPGLGEARSPLDPAILGGHRVGRPPRDAVRGSTASRASGDGSGGSVKSVGGPGTIREGGVGGGAPVEAGVIVEAFDAGTSMLTAIYRMEGFDAAVVVDAIDFGGEPGDVIVFDPDGVESARTGISLHRFDVVESIKMMRRLGELPVGDIRIVAVQPDEIRQGVGLSEPVAMAVERAVGMVFDTVQSMASRTG